MKRDLVTLTDWKADQIEAIFRKADQLKRSKARPLSGKTLALVFQKPSMRTRVSFEVGMFQLGGQAIYLGPEGIQLGIRESVADIAQGLSRYVHGIVARTFSHPDHKPFSSNLPDHRIFLFQCLKGPKQKKRSILPHGQGVFSFESFQRPPRRPGRQGDFPRRLRHVFRDPKMCTKGFRTTVAPIGTPPPNVFASVMTSGTIP